MSEPNETWEPAPEPRWLRELKEPERFTAIYLNETAMRTLKYTLSHVTGYSDVTLSEAVQMMCDEWIKLDNLRLRHERDQKDTLKDVGVRASQGGDWPIPNWCGNQNLHGPHGECVGHTPTVNDTSTPKQTSTTEPTPAPRPAPEPVHEEIKDKQCDIPQPHSGHEWEEELENGERWIRWCKGINIRPPNFDLTPITDPPLLEMPKEKREPRDNTIRRNPEPDYNEEIRRPIGFQAPE